MPRRTRILLFAIVSAVVIVSVAWVATITAPNPGAPTVGIANATDVEVDPGGPQAVVFPFQLAPDSQSDEDSSLTVSSASVSATIEVPACDEANDTPCPGVIVEIFTSDQVAQFGIQTNLTGTTGGSYSIDLTSFAGDPLDLVVWSASGVQWADISAQGSWSD
jgi:hypothetical protein